MAVNASGIPAVVNYSSAKRSLWSIYSEEAIPQLYFAQFPVASDDRLVIVGSDRSPDEKLSVSTIPTMIMSSFVGRIVACFSIAAILSAGVSATPPAVLSAVRVIQCGAGEHQRPAVVTGVAITPDGGTIAAATDDHQISIWNANNGELTNEFAGHSDWVHAVVLSRDGSTLASGAGDRSVCIWSMARQQPVFQIPACRNSIAAVSLHPNNHQLAVVGFCSELDIVDTATGEVTQHKEGPGADIRTIAFSPQGDCMAAAGRKGAIRIWNVADRTNHRDIETGGRRIRSLAFSPDGTRIAAAGHSPNIEIFDVATGQSLMTLATRPAKVYSLVFLDSQHLATGGSDNRVTVWDLDSRMADSQLVGHSGTVAALACDSTGRTLVSGGYDTTLRVWNLAERQATTAWRKAASDAR